jgi:hypothetical protein
VKIARIVGVLAVTAAVLATTAGARIEHYFVNVSVTGPGHVTGSGSPSDPNSSTINCPPKCNASFVTGSTGTLNASADAGATFTGWGGACSGTGGCTFTAGEKANVNVSATFEGTGPYMLTVDRGGSGSGSVSGSLTCPPTCTGSFPKDSSVSLTATAAPGSTFARWEASCSGTGACNLTMDGPKSVTAIFEGPPETTTTTSTGPTHTLTVNRVGAGAGTVTGTGIACGATCTVVLPQGTAISLAAAAAAGSTFGGWNGPCSGTAACTFALNADASVIATFDLIPPPKPKVKLTIEKTGPGYVGGAGIDCGPVCTSEVDEGTTIALVAAPGAGAKFLGWSGSCGTLLTCTVKLDTSQTILARFAVPDTLPPNVRAFSAKAKRGGMARLRFSAADKSGRALVVNGAILSGKTTLARLTKRLARPGPGAFTWRVPVRAPSTLRFCARATDAAGNRSRLVCAAVKVT